MGSREGVLKTAANRTGLSLDAYLARCSAGEKWCTNCKTWHPRGEFGEDRTRTDGLASVCLRTRYKPVPQLRLNIAKRIGWLKPARNNDKDQARQRVNYLVAKRRLPPPNTLPCTDCGHVWREGGPRHEYDHYLRYTADHQRDVQAVCKPCHVAREQVRRRAQ